MFKEHLPPEMARFKRRWFDEHDSRECSIIGNSDRRTLFNSNHWKLYKK